VQCITCSRRSAAASPGTMERLSGSSMIITPRQWQACSGIGSAGGRGRAAGAARRAGQPAAGRRARVRRGAGRPRGAPAVRRRALHVKGADAAHLTSALTSTRLGSGRPARAGLGVCCCALQARGARRWMCSWTATMRKASWSAARSGAPARLQRAGAGHGLRRQDAERPPAAPSDRPRLV